MRTKRSPWRRLKFIIPLVVVVVVAAAVGQYLRPLPSVRLVRTVSAQIRIPGASPTLPWPTAGEAAVAVQGVGTLGTHGGNQPEAIGSVAKVMTAVLVLKAHPIGVGESGPAITVTPQDVATYQADNAGGQSVVQVAAGEQLTELQALEAMLIPSGNNIATLLAQWDAGSEAAFVTQMNQEAARLGLTHTHYADASGLSAETVSTASDQTKLAELAMTNPTFASIVALPQVTLPVAGVAYNVNSEVTHDGFIGVKTGSTPQAGGCFVFAVQHKVDGRSVTVIGAVLGQGGVSELTTALNEGVSLADATFAALTAYTVVPRDGEIATLTEPWSNPVPVASPQSVSLVGWPGLLVHTKLVSDRLGSTVAAGMRVGTFSLAAGQFRQTMTLTAPAPIRAPSIRWRLTRL
jgi:D-alanyl-D-alanine carboxypeptidase (penicillin-binding protein 5/6)